ncbi:MAG: cyclic pyranopterin monophosphate synthase MoaC [Candidatus Lokiarchaeota archaeon]|nr:cyclic pyranopterin monophosphate synthase MoaC [Candidatus Lokiarchaeota archaeon]
MSKSNISMVDISEKEDIFRTAIAEGKIFLKKETIEKIKDKEIKKGDILTAAELAAISAVKKTPELIVLAHPIPIMKTDVDFKINEVDKYITCRVEVKSIAKTGVELEALNGVMISLLTIWDFTKYLEKNKEGQYPSTHITDVRVIKKIKSKIKYNNS